MDVCFVRGGAGRRGLLVSRFLFISVMFSPSRVFEKTCYLALEPMYDTVTISGCMIVDIRSSPL